MKRTLEWVLAGIGAILCVGGAAITWISQASPNTPDISLWPLPALVLIEVAIFGLAGFTGVVLAREDYSPRWAGMLWIACGGLTALATIGAFSVSVVVLLAVPAMLFASAAVLTDIRRHRNMWTDLGLFSVSAVANFLIFFTFISAVRI